MATYTGTTQAKRGFGKMIWVAIVAFVVAAALTVAILAMQSGSSVPASGAGQTQTQTHTRTDTQTNRTGGGSGEVQTIPLGKGICAQCAP